MMPEPTMAIRRSNVLRICHGGREQVPPLRLPASLDLPETRARPSVRACFTARAPWI
ncbi:MAG: hypothetical protein ACI8QC_003490 [Planctomycetota bacterium]|jgi:hypothetical protein